MFSSASSAKSVLVEARLSEFLTKSNNAEIYQIISANICDRQKKKCRGGFEYEIKFVEQVYGEKTNSKIYFGDREISVGSFAMIFSRKDKSFENGYYYFNRFYKLIDRNEISSDGKLRHYYLVSIHDSALIEDIPNLKPFQENQEICISEKCQNYGVGVYIKYSNFLAVINQFRKN